MEVFAAHKDIEKFVTGLEASTRAEVLRLINVLAIRGYHIAMPHSKRIERGIYELRVKSSQSVRIFFTFHANSAVLLHVVLKNSQKLRPEDIRIAQKRLASLQ